MAQGIWIIAEQREGELIKKNINPDDYVILLDNKGTQSFDPPGEVQDGNDWVLVLDSI